MGMKSLKWEGIGTKNLFPHTSNTECAKNLGLYFEALYLALFLGLNESKNMIDKTAHLLDNRVA